ncbi:MAG: PP0621 family protein [Sulfuricaulis sp.]
MGQLLRIVIILIGLWLVLQLVRRSRTTRQNPYPAPPPIAKMVCCGHCGVHVPESEAIGDNNNVYCCEDHRNMARRRQN